ncbi:MAG: flavin reductase family protein [Deltaproteobacteria bacterium]|nr:flavin reductase family protein [Deltaproteobacteria bacterium]
MPKTRLDPGPFVLPMPTALIGAVVDGKPNFMTAAFVGIANFKPTIVACGLSPTHHTCQGIAAHGEFSVSLPGPELVEATDWCGLNSGKRADKSRVFETFAGELAHAPMVKACRLAAECRVVKTVEFAVDTVYFGEVVGVYADEESLKDGAPDWQKIAPLLFTFPDKAYWRFGEHMAAAWSVGKGYAP